MNIQRQTKTVSRAVPRSEEGHPITQHGTGKDWMTHDYTPYYTHLMLANFIKIVDSSHHQFLDQIQRCKWRTFFALVPKPTACCIEGVQTVPMASYCGATWINIELRWSNQAWEVQTCSVSPHGACSENAVLYFEWSPPGRSEQAALLANISLKVSSEAQTCQVRLQQTPW